MLMVASCYYDKEGNLYPTATCDSASVSFDTVIKPKLFVPFCNNGICHATANRLLAGNVALETHADAKDAVQTKKLLCAIEHTGCSNMPKNSPKMSACNIALINKWVRDGFPQ